MRFLIPGDRNENGSRCWAEDHSWLGREGRTADLLFLPRETVLTAGSTTRSQRKQDMAAMPKGSSRTMAVLS